MDLWKQYGWVFTIAIIALPVTAWIAVDTPGRDGPVELVEDYFAAIQHKNVAAALALVDRFGTGVPIGEEAAFLDPRAIADGWGLISATETRRDDDGEVATVTVTLAGPDGTADGELLVSRGYQRPWRLHTPFVRVEFAASPLSFVQVNNLTVPVDRGPGGGQPASFLLFPGMYKLYPQLPSGVDGAAAEPVLAFPNFRHGRSSAELLPYQVSPGQLSVTEPGVTAVASEVNALLDECTEFSTLAPYECPFATDGEIDTPEGDRVTDPEDLQWSVLSYPQLSLVDQRDERDPAGFRVVAEVPGVVTLTGSGVNQDGETVAFTVECGIELTTLMATFGADDKARVDVTPWREDLGNTCYRSP